MPKSLLAIIVATVAAILLFEGYLNEGEVASSQDVSLMAFTEQVDTAIDTPRKVEEKILSKTPSQPRNMDDQIIQGVTPKGLSIEGLGLNKKEASESLEKLVREIGMPSLTQAYDEYQRLQTDFAFLMENLNEGSSLGEIKDLKMRLDELAEEMSDLIEEYVLESYPT